MKKLFLFTLIICLAFSSVTAFAYGVTLDGAQTSVRPLFVSQSVYLSVEEVAQILGSSTDWDEKTQTVFVNGIYLFPKKGSGVTVYVDGEKKIEGEAIVKDGKVYLPAHITAAAFGLSASWDDNTGTVVLLSQADKEQVTAVTGDKTYAIINKASGKALSATDNGLTTEEYTSAPYQEFKFVQTEFAGFYHIKSVLTGKNLDVNAHGTTPGVSIITWDPGTGDNQKFALEFVSGGTLISARSCHLPIEPSGGGIIQNTKTLSSNQKWEIIEFGTAYEKKAVTVGKELVVKNIPPEPADETPKQVYSIFSIGSQTLADENGLKAVEGKTNTNAMWVLTELGTGVYVITNLATNKSIDVSGRSLEEGGSIITYSTNSASNQKWVLEPAGDGTYLIKSVHSSLYLTINDDNTLIQAAKNSDLKQKWTITKTN